jgi:hypothetical protein
MNILTGTGIGNDSASSIASELMGRTTTSGAMIALKLIKMELMALIEFPERLSTAN